MTIAQRLREALVENLDIVFEAMELKFSQSLKEKRRWGFVRKGTPKALETLYGCYLKNLGWEKSKDSILLVLSFLGYCLVCESKVEETMAGVSIDDEGNILGGQITVAQILLKAFKEGVEDFVRFHKDVYAYITVPFVSTLKELGIPEDIIPDPSTVYPADLLQLYQENKHVIIGNVISDDITSDLFKDL